MIAFGLLVISHVAAMPVSASTDSARTARVMSASADAGSVSAAPPMISASADAGSTAVVVPMMSASADAGSISFGLPASSAQTDGGSPIDAQNTSAQTEEPPETAPHADVSAAHGDRRTLLQVHGIGGVGAGVLIVPVPAPFASPWAGFGAYVERKILKQSWLGLDFSFSLGNDESGKPIGGYHLLASAGTAWIDSRFFVLETEVRGGLTSFLLVPLPDLGGVATLMFQPFRGDHFRWRLGAETGLDFVLFLPVLSGGLFSEVRWQIGAVHFGLKLNGGYSLGVFNGAGVAASAKLFAGVSF